jgi:hypothetical protein
MRQSKVTLPIRIRTADGRQPYCKPVWLNRNELKPLWAFVKGRPEHRPEGVYHLRYTYKGQRAGGKLLGNCRKPPSMPATSESGS